MSFRRKKLKIGTLEKNVKRTQSFLMLPSLRVLVIFVEHFKTKDSKEFWKYQLYQYWTRQDI